MDWQKAISLEDMAKKGRVLFRTGGKLIALFKLGNAIFAVDNRCPHQGYPLLEGSVDSDGRLICHWHNWLFDMKTGECLSGGDSVKIYKTEVKAGFIWVNISEPSKEELTRQILSGLKTAFEKHKYGRMSRELAKLYFYKIDPMAGIEAAIEWSCDTLKKGMSHSLATVSDWLRLHEEQKGNMENQLICLTEAIDHLSAEVYRQGPLPRVGMPKKYSRDVLMDAFERGDEDEVVALTNGAFEEGLCFKELEEVFMEVTFKHYLDFGHALTDVLRTSQFIDILEKGGQRGQGGEGVEKDVTLALAVSLCHAKREDLLPEFRDYHRYSDMYLACSPKEKKRLGSEALVGKTVNDSMQWVVDQAKQYSAEALYLSLLEAVAKNVLFFDISFQTSYEKPVSQNVDFKDIAHGLLFANAVRVQCQKFPKFWKYGLLQLACFQGRHAPFVEKGVVKDSEWRVGDPEHFLKACINKILDHGLGSAEQSVHWIQTFFSVRDELHVADVSVQATLLSALNRYLHSPVKEKHTRRKARQNIFLISQDFK